MGETSYLTLSKDNLAQFGEDIFTKIKNKGINLNEFKPIASQTYQNIIATANNQEAGTFYYLQIFPEAANQPCKVFVRVQVYLNESMIVSTKNNYYQDYYIELVFLGNKMNRYVTDNEVYDTSYRPVYYNTVYPATKNGISAGYPHYFGTSLYNSSHPTSAAYKRDFKIDLLGIDGGTFSFLETPLLQSSFVSSYYRTLTNLNAYSSGKFGTGIPGGNTYDRTYLTNVQGVAGEALYGTQLVLSADGQTYYSITQNRSTETTSKVNQVPFDITYLYYYNSATTISKGSKTAVSTFYVDVPFDFRYSSNCGSTLTIQKPIYLVATKDFNTNLFSLVEDIWWTQSPTQSEDNYYIYLGISYTAYTIYFEQKHPIYIYRNGIFKQLEAADDNLVYCTSANLANQSLVNGRAYLTENKKLYIDKNIGEGIERFLINEDSVIYLNSSDDSSFVSKKGIFYIYQDKIGESNAIKIGDGTSYLVDMPFFDKYIVNHINNTDIHVTKEEKDFWNNKVSCYLDSSNSEQLVFTTS